MSNWTVGLKSFTQYFCMIIFQLVRTLSLNSCRKYSPCMRINLDYYDVRDAAMYETLT